MTLCSRLLGSQQVKARRRRRRYVKLFGEAEYDGVPVSAFVTCLVSERELNANDINSHDHKYIFSTVNN